MSIYKNKFIVEKEFYGLFQKELYSSRNLPYTPVIVENEVGEPVVKPQPEPVV